MTENNDEAVLDTVKMRDSPVEYVTKASTSPLKKYQSIYVGGNSLLDLLKYEIIITLFSSMRGALGFAMRKYFFRSLFNRTGRGMIVGPGIAVRCPKNISLGDDVVFDGDVVLDAKGNKSLIEIGDSVFLGKHTIVSCSSARINLADNISIGPNCYIRASRGDVSLGSDITIGPNSVIISGNPGHKRLDIPMMKQEGPALGITIEDDVWMGVGVRIVDGVRVGKGSVIGAGAVVLDEIPDYSIAVGVPAKVIGTRLTQTSKVSSG